MAGPLLHVKEAAAPPTVGVPVVLAKKACEGAVPDMEDKNQAQELMPLHIHLTYLLPHTHRALHAIFRQVDYSFMRVMYLIIKGSFWNIYTACFTSILKGLWLKLYGVLRIFFIVLVTD